MQYDPRKNLCLKGQEEGILKPHIYEILFCFLTVIALYLITLRLNRNKEMKIIQPKRYLWIAPLIILISGIQALMNNDQGKAGQVLWYIYIFFSIVLLILGVINHKKYYQKTEIHQKKQKNAL